MAAEDRSDILEALSSAPISTNFLYRPREHRNDVNQIRRKRSFNAVDGDPEYPKKLGPGFPKENTQGNIENDVDLTESSQNLCDQCLQINFDVLTSKYIIGTRILVLQDQTCSTCNLCRFFDQIKWVPLEMPIGKPISFDLIVGPRIYKQLTQLAIIPSHFPDRALFGDSDPELKTNQRLFFASGNVREGSKVHGRPLATNSVDFDRIRDWLDFCDYHHTELCNKWNYIPRLTLIDCQSRRLVKIDKLRDSYVTLSYVWGPSPPISTPEPGKLLENLETTIEDSIAVATALNFKYLWVDRYCIPQDNPEEKHVQVQRMGEIYANSSLTIIAAAGDDPAFGLPGISNVRKECPSITFGSVKLVAMPSVSHEVRVSTWNKRGWTYQEGLLARRRLVFTKSQVYFQCAAMHCQESLEIPIPSFHIKSFQRFRDEFPGIFPRYGIGKRTEEIVDRIAEYAGRQLSYPSDIIHAFQGILNAYMSFQTPVYHFWGVIIFSPETFRRSAEKSISEMFAFGLCWCTHVFGTRRPGFPSWSWCGWQFEEVLGPTLKLVCPPKKIGSEVFFIPMVEISPGTISHLEDSNWLDSEEPFGGDVSSVLVVQAWTVDIDAMDDTPVPLYVSVSTGRKWTDRPILNTQKPRWQMKDLHASLAQAIRRASFNDPESDDGTIQITAMMIGKTEGSAYADYFFIFLCWNSTRQLYERLPFVGRTFERLDVSQVSNGNLRGWSLTRHQIRLG